MSACRLCDNVDVLVLDAILAHILENVFQCYVVPRLRLVADPDCLKREAISFVVE